MSFRTILSLSVSTGMLLALLVIFFITSRVLAVREMQLVLIDNVRQGYASVAVLERGAGHIDASGAAPTEWWQALDLLSLPSGCCLEEWQRVVDARGKDASDAEQAINTLAQSIKRQLAADETYVKSTVAANREFAIFVALGLLLIGAMCWWLVHRGILRPLGDLILALQRHSATGQFHFQPGDRGATEVTLLSKLFGDVITRLETDLSLTQNQLNDIKEASREEAEAMGRELAELIDGSGAPIFTLTGEGVIDTWNRKMAALTGVPNTAAHGRPFGRGFLDGSARLAFNEATKLAMEGTPVEGYRIDLLSASGATVSILLHIAPKRNSSGDVEGVTCFGSQVDQFLVTTAKAMEKQRTDHFNDLASGAAHQLNQPLQKMRLLLTNAQNRLRRTEIDKDLVIEKLRGADSELSAMSEIVEHLRLFGRQAPAVAGGFSLSVIVERCVDLAKGGFIDQGINLSVSNDLHDHKVEGHPVQIEKTLLAILDNAREALTDTSPIAPSVAISAWCTPDGREARLSIKDNGGGIDITVQDKVFDPFFTTKLGGRNVGLGLTSARALIEDMGGVITLSSAGESTVIEIALPVITQHGVEEALA